MFFRLRSSAKLHPRRVNLQINRIVSIACLYSSKRSPEHVLTPIQRPPRWWTELDDATYYVTLFLLLPETHFFHDQVHTRHLFRK